MSRQACRVARGLSVACLGIPLYGYWLHRRAEKARADELAEIQKHRSFVSD
ncbi:MAG TPA: hypothetical protein VGL34_21795 [Steroidobacteraceae bacterium]